MSVQKTLIIVKPDGLVKGLVGQILCKIKYYNLKVVESARVQLTKKLVRKLYSGEEKEVYFNDVVNWVSSGYVLILVIMGEDAIEKVKWQIIGRYPNGIRGKYSEDWIKNVAHAPDSEKSSIRELELIKIFFEGSKVMDLSNLGNKVIFALTGMSECGKSTVGKYLDTKGVPRLKIVRFFERVRDIISPGAYLYDFIQDQEAKDPYALWDAFIKELLSEMEKLNVNRITIESLYGGGLGPYLKQRLKDHFYIVYVDIPQKIRLQRQMIRENLSSIAAARKILIPRDKIKADSGIPDLKRISEVIIDNSGTLDNLYDLVDKMLEKY